MKEKTCCFTGHRAIPSFSYNELKILLQKNIKALIEKGVINFISGGALGFDTLAAETVLELKSLFPQINLIMAYPCKNQTAYWKEKDVEIYNYIMDSCDRYLYVSEKYDSSCMFKRNRYIVTQSKYCICYLQKSNGGTFYTVNYAKKQGLTIINLAQK